MPHRAREHWTPEEVGERVIAAFAARPRSDDDAKAIDWASVHLLPEDEGAQIALLTWAAVRAGTIEASVSEWCREKGWGRRTFDRARKRGARKIAESLNRLLALTSS